MRWITALLLPLPRLVLGKPNSIRILTMILGWWCCASSIASPSNATPWKRHSIDQSSQGADGVRSQDINQDGLPDIVTGWEEGGQVRAYLHPGPLQVGEPWPAVTVGHVPSVEDALWMDIDGDGYVDVLSCAEGNQKSVNVHWAPHDGDQLLIADAWKTTTIPAAKHRMMWMFALPSSSSPPGFNRLWAAGKGPNAALGWWQFPARSRQSTGWSWQPLRPVGWIMSLRESDMDDDGDADLVFTDRRGPKRGCFWLENPGSTVLENLAWPEHPIGGIDQEVMFMNLADMDGDELQDVLIAMKPRVIGWYRRLDASGLRWKLNSIPFPENTGTAKAVAAGDIDLDGKLDLIISCEQATGSKSGVFGLLQKPNLDGTAIWTAIDISGPTGVKFDLVELLDLDGDGDLDVVTCEEKTNLGVIWYENHMTDPSEGRYVEESLAGEPSPRRTFLDATVLEETQNLTRVFHSAEKHSTQPVLVKDRPWEGWGPYLYGTVLRDGDRFKMWYTCIGKDSGFVCYAESADGLNWTKPNLGLYEFHGSTSNNIVGKFVEPSVVPIRQPESPDRSWALFCWAGERGATAAFSGDGLHWDWSNAQEKLFPTSDVVNFFYDPYHRGYTATYKTPSRRHRAVGIATSHDGLNWTKPVEGPVFTADDLDPDATQIYGMPVFPYQGMYVGLPWLYHARFFKYGDYTVDRMNEAQVDSPRTVDVQMAWSWDLIHWTRPPEREPFIALGDDGSWDDGMIFTARAPVVVGNELWFYYGGFDRVHDDYKGIQGAVGLATLRMDGFCSWRADTQEGQARSRREVFLTPEIYINARTESDSYVLAELLDTKNRVLPGFSRADCLGFQGDDTAHLFTWHRREFTAKEAKSVKKIRFYLRNAELFSYWPKELDTELDQGNRDPR